MNQSYSSYVDFQAKTAENLGDKTGQIGSGFKYNAGGHEHIYLYLIKPRDMSDQVIRPMTYRFGSEFKNELGNLLDRTSTMLPAQTQTACRDYLTNSPAAQAAILPAVDKSMRVNMSPFRAAWTFLMMVDTTFGSSVIGTTASAPHRELYSGWIASGDEPAVMTSTGHWNINPNALISIARASQNTVCGIGGYGGGVINDGDVNILTREQLSAVDRPRDIYGQSSELYSLDTYTTGSAACANSTLAMTNFTTANNDQPYNIRFGNPICSRYGDGSLATEITDTVAKDYGYQLNNCVQGMVSMTQSKSEDIDNGSLLMDNDVPNVCAELTSAMSIRSAVRMKFDPKQIISLRELMDKYDDCLDIGVIDAPFDVQYDRTDVMANTPQNIAYAILAAALPNAMSDNCLADISFVYDTTNRDIASPTGIAEPVILQWSTIHEKVNAASAVRRFIQTLVSTVLRKILLVFGHFRVSCHASISGATIMEIYLYDHSNNDGGFYETNSLMDSLNTNLVGTYDDLNNNSYKFAELAQTVTAVVGKNSNINTTFLPEYINSDMSYHQQQTSDSYSDTDYDSALDFGNDDALLF